MKIVGEAIFPPKSQINYRGRHYPYERADRLAWKDARVELSRELFWEVPRALDFTLPKLVCEELRRGT